jgi:iron(III) transport system substrate-binding protein
MRKSKWCIWVCLFAFAGILAGCGAAREADDVAAEPRLVVYCALTSPFIESMINEFEKQTGVRVDLLPGDAVAYRSERETADVFFGIPVPMADAHLDDFRGYRSINEYHIRPDFRQPAGRITCFARSLNVILVNTNLLGERRLRGYHDLLAPELNGQVVFSDPVHSAAGYRHFVNMLADMGGDTPAGWDFVRRFCRQAATAASATEAAEAVAKGRYTAALTSENAALTQVLAGAPVRVVYMQEGVQSYLHGVSIAAGTKNRLDAEKFVDFVTSKGTQFVLMRQLYYRPVRDDVLTIRPLLPAAELPVAVEMADFSWQQREDYLAKFVAGMKANGIKP